MKLVYCFDCDSMVRLVRSYRSCECGKVGGKYLNENDAIYHGTKAIPVGMGSTSFPIAVANQPESGMGETFLAFVIPKQCDSFIKRSKKACT